jgi:hypothetical protein
LYKACIKETSKLYADAFVHTISEITKLVGLYAMISEMRVIPCGTLWKAPIKLLG